MTQTSDSTQTPGVPPPSGAAAHSMWDDILRTGVRRDRSRQWFAGVCSGLARRFDVDPVLIRAAVIALTIFGGVGVMLYILAWLFMPDEDGTILARSAVSGQGGSEATGAIVLVVFALVVFSLIVFGDNGFLAGWVLVPIAVVGWLVWRRTQSSDQRSQVAQESDGSMYAVSAPAPTVAPHPGSGDQAVPGQAPEWQPPAPPSFPPQAGMPLAPPPPPRPRRRTAGFAGLALTLGIAAVGYGVGFLLDGPVGFSGSAELLGMIVALSASALTTLAIGLSGRRSLLSAALVVLLGLGTVGASVGDRLWEDGQRGARTFTPAISSQPQRFQHGGGDVTLDLRPLAASLAAPGAVATPQQISVDQTVGELTVIVPSTANARVEAEVRMGNIEIQDSLPGAGLANDQSDRNGPGLQRTVSIGAGAPTIVVDAELRFGEITIKEG